MREVTSAKAFYEQDAQAEWERLERYPIEFEMGRRFMARYVKSGQSILDAGGGPGRYALHWAQRGCRVTLVDLAGGHVDFALGKAKELGAELSAVQGDVLDIERVAPGSYDHVFLMGPLYHLLQEEERERAVKGCLALLKPGGLLFATFIQNFAGVIYAMREDPGQMTDPKVRSAFEAVARDESWAGPSFTEAFFIRPGDILPFMGRFGLEKLHFLGQEGILAPCQAQILDAPRPVRDAWLDYAERLCEREEFLSYSEHLLYIGRKPGAEEGVG